MATRAQILKDTRSYSAAEIADAINRGEVSIYELSKGGNLTPLLRRRIEAILNNQDNSTPQNNTSEMSPVSQTAPNSIQEQIVESQTDTTIMPLPESENQTIYQSTPTTPTFRQQPPAFQQQTPIYPQQPQLQEKHGMLSFRGRIRRTSYILSLVAFTVIVAIAEFLCMTAIIEKNMNFLYVLAAAILIFGLVFICSQAARRCHDLNHSGWWQLIPFYGFIMIFGNGTHGYNQFGADPKA